MIVLQSRSSGHDILCERVMLKDAKHHASEPCQFEEACEIIETRETILSHGRMVEEATTFSDSDWAGCKETRKIIKRRRDTVRQPHPESVHAQAKDHCKKQRRGRTECGSIGERSESKGSVSLLKDLDYEMKPVLAIDAKATEQILL